MVEFALGVVLLIAIFATKRMWSAYIRQKADDVEVIIEDMRNDQQAEIKRVHDARARIIEAQGNKWYSVEDIIALQSTQK